MISAVFLAFFAALGGTPADRLWAESPPRRLQAEPRAGDLQHVRVVMEVKGDLKLNPDGTRVTRLPLEARGQLAFDQRVLESDPAGEHRRDARYYQQAEVTFRVGQAGQQVQLGDPRRLVVADATGDAVTLFSPLGPLSQDELELIDLPGNPTLLYRLLPAVEVRVGDQWRHEDALVAELLGLDVVAQNDLQSTLRAVEDTVALIDLSGSVRGAVGGVSSDVQVKAKLNFDLERQQVTWLAMSIKENRAIGHAKPGFEVTARLRVAIDAADAAPQLNDQALAGLQLAPDSGVQLLRFRSAEAGVGFLHDRTWLAMVDRHDVVILRMVERGDFIAQCNASRLPPLEAGQRVALEAFQADLQRGLGEQFGEFVESSQRDQGPLRVLRVVAAGLASELPIQWVGYHLSDDRGRQASLVFTMDAKLVERFAEADQVIVSSFEFLDGAEAEELPAPAAAAALDSAAGPSVR